MRVFMSVRNNFGCLISYRMISDWVEGFLCAVANAYGSTCYHRYVARVRFQRAMRNGFEVVEGFQKEINGLP